MWEYIYPMLLIPALIVWAWAQWQIAKRNEDAIVHAKWDAFVAGLPDGSGERKRMVAAMMTHDMAKQTVVQVDIERLLKL